MIKKRFVMAPLAVGLFAAYRRLRRRDLPYPRTTPANSAEVGLSQKIIHDLPRWGYYVGGKPMEWMNLIIIGSEADLVRILETAGWYSGDPVTPWVLMKSFLAITFHRQYLHGPFTPIFIEHQQQKLSYQKPTKLNQFKQRHHARFWPTKHQDKAAQSVWIAHASYDIDIKAAGFLKPPVHEIDRNIDAEREVLVADMMRAGARLRGYIQFQPAGGGVNAYGDAFESDGRAAIIEVSEGT